MPSADPTETDTTSPGAASSSHRARFHELEVVDIERLTDDAVAVTFQVPEHLAAEYAFLPGQHLTVRAEIKGDDVRQSYSICQSLHAAGRSCTRRVAVARVPKGRMSNWINDELQVGQRLGVMTPLGSFTCATRPRDIRHHVAIAAGSGITPVISLLATALEEEPRSRATLVFGNRRTDTIMFLEELADLKSRFLDRFQVIHVLSREPQEVELFHGRLDPDRLGRLLTAVVPVDSADEWYLCGPFGMVTGAQQLLRGRGVDERRIHSEIFHVDDGGEPRRKVVIDESASPEAVVTVTLDGRTSVVPMPSREEVVLDAVRRVRSDAPFSCTNGVCGTCRAKLLSGEVRMDRNYALEPDEVTRGLVLTCQSHPVTDEVSLDYDV